MRRNLKDRLCARCDHSGFKFHAGRWLCVIHYRIVTMQNCARAKGKSVPTNEQLQVLIDALIQHQMKCEACGTTMQWTGKKGSLTTVTLQHDRSGRLRLICMLCNQRHDDLPGDSFYDLPPNSWRCARCENVLPLDAFYPGRAGSCCKTCRKTLNREMWARFGKTWYQNSQRRKQCK